MRDKRCGRAAKGQRSTSAISQEGPLYSFEYGQPTTGVIKVRSAYDCFSTGSSCVTMRVSFEGVQHWKKAALQTVASCRRESMRKGPPCLVQHKRRQPLIQHGVKSALHKETMRAQVSTREGQSHSVDKSRPLLVQHRTSSTPHEVAVYAQMGKRRGLSPSIEQEAGASPAQRKTHTAAQAGAPPNHLSSIRGSPCSVELRLQRPLVKSGADTTHCVGSHSTPSSA